jgi:hypothetical protein
MTHDDTPDIDLTGDLQSLGITSLCQWDVMVFLHRHGDTLTGANHLARLLGYETALIVTAIEALEAAGHPWMLEVARCWNGCYLSPATAPVVYAWPSTCRWAIKRLVKRCKQGGDTSQRADGQDGWSG